MMTGVQSTQFKNQEQFQYPLIERIVIGFAFGLIAIFLYLLLTNASLRHLFFNTADEELASQPIGKVIMIQGNVSREKTSDTEFEILRKEDKLFPNDTVMTGTGGAVIIELNDGQKLVMEQNSLIKLNFDYDFSLSSLIPRQFLTQNVIKKEVATIKVQTKVGKEVKKFTATEFKQQVAVKPIEKIVETKPQPVIAEIPQKVLEVLTTPNQRIFFSTSNVKEGFKLIPLQFKLSQNSDKIKVRVTKQKAIVSDLIVPDMLTNISVDFKITSPGEYVWEIFNKFGNSLSKNSIIVEPTVSDNSITGLAVLNTSSKMEGLSSQNVFPGFNLKWDPFDSTKYKITIKDLKNSKTIATLSSNTTQVVFSKNVMIVDKKMAFKVEQTTKNGFILSSKEYPFSFEYLPPTLASPEKDANISISSFKGTQKKIFFTWSKTNYSTGYEFQYSEDQKFEDTIISKKLKDNFFVLTNPVEGTFYWRVRTLAEDAASKYSESFKLVIKE